MDIAKTLKDAVDAGDLPGVAAAAATDKGVIFEGSAGVLQPDSVVWIASMTKAVTGAAAMQLVERGKLTLDGPASDIVPELATKGVLEGFDASGKTITRKPRRPITLRHLLTHTSGLGYDTWNADVMKYREATGIPRSARAGTQRSPRRCSPSRARGGSMASRSTGWARWSRRRAASGSIAI
jgi:CubicO group peptidase (beta-lactamase class C family)